MYVIFSVEKLITSFNTPASASAPMLSLEFSFGRLNGEDIRALIEPLTLLASRIGDLDRICFALWLTGRLKLDSRTSLS